MTSERSEAYLSRLRRELRKHGLVGRRMVDEARDHLVDAIEGGIQRGLSPEAAERDALARFGSTDAIGAEFGRLYPWAYALWYLVKIAASVVVAVTAALAIEVVVNLRVELQEEALRLAPGFGRTAMMAVAIVLGLATVWEIGRRPFQLRRATIALGAYAVTCLVARLLFAQGIQAFGSATLLVIVGYLCSRLERRPLRFVVTFAMFVVSLFAIHRFVHVSIDPARAALAGAVLTALHREGRTIVMVTHDEHVASYAPRALFLRDGKVLSDMTRPVEVRVS